MSAVNASPRWSSASAGCRSGHRTWISHLNVAAGLERRPAAVGDRDRRQGLPGRSGASGDHCRWRAGDDAARVSRPLPALCRLSRRQFEARRPGRRHARQPPGVHDRAVRHHRQSRHAGVDRPDGNGVRCRPYRARCPRRSPRSSACRSCRSSRRCAPEASSLAARRSWSTATSPTGSRRYETAAEPLDFAKAANVNATISSPSITPRARPARRRAACCITAGGCASSTSTSGCSDAAGRTGSSAACPSTMPTRRSSCSPPSPRAAPWWRCGASRCRASGTS